MFEDTYSMLSLRHELISNLAFSKPLTTLSSLTKLRKYDVKAPIFSNVIEFDTFPTISFLKMSISIIFYIIQI